MLIKRLKKSASLRIVSLLGLTAIFCCLTLSYSFIKKELSYDRFHENAGRIARFSIQWDNMPVDGRNWGASVNSPYLSGIAGIEDILFMDKVNTGVLTSANTPRIVNNFYFAGSNFFDVFDFRLLEGESRDVLNTPEKAVISKSLAAQLYGDESPVGKEIRVSGRKFNEKTVFISGVFDDFPEASHFHTDLLLHRPDSEARDWAYVYLLLEQGADLGHVKEAIDKKLDGMNPGNQQKASACLMPLTAIHLHSHVLRELETNGSITYIYLIISANILLLLIVLFNLWLNAGLIFSFNRKYYQLLRLNGASVGIVFRDESLMAIGLGIASVLLGSALSYLLSPVLKISAGLPARESIGISLTFLLVVWLVSVLPALAQMSTTLFRYDSGGQNAGSFSLSKVKYMLIAQYVIVMFVVILGAGINKQMRLIASSQVGGKENTILVMDEQPETVKQRYEVLKNELLKHPEIKQVTSAMQLPGSAIRDLVKVQVEGQSSDDSYQIPILVVGDDFLPFFRIKPLAGTVFRDNPLSLQEEQALSDNFADTNTPSEISEEYIINLAAVRELGFSRPEEAIGKIIRIEQGALDYINKGRIVGVTENYNYTTTFEETRPQLLMQRKCFQHCIMADLSPDHTEEALAAFKQVWNKINPDYPADYRFLQDVYGKVYHNQVKAQSMAEIFSILCLIVANLGLIIITSFIIKRKTKEIGIRKVNGATVANIIGMLNNRFVLWIALAFVIAVPCAYLMMDKWLEQFASKAEPDIWMYAFAGLLVLALSMISISWQSWKAATVDPVKAIKME